MGTLSRLDGYGIETGPDGRIWLVDKFDAAIREARPLDMEDQGEDGMIISASLVRVRWNYQDRLCATRVHMALQAREGAYTLCGMRVGKQARKVGGHRMDPDTFCQHCYRILARLEDYHAEED